MRSEPSETCARCGEAFGQDWLAVLAPFGWVNYLCESRGMDRPIDGEVYIPLCNGCWIRVDALKASPGNGVVAEGVPEDVGVELTVQEGIRRELDRFLVDEIYEELTW